MLGDPEPGLGGDDPTDLNRGNARQSSVRGGGACVGPLKIAVEAYEDW